MLELTAGKLFEDGLNMGNELVFVIGLLITLEERILLGVAGFKLKPFLLVESASGEGDAILLLVLSNNEFKCLFDLCGLMPMERVFLDISLNRACSSLVVF